MPYIDKKDREALINGDDPLSPGELNFIISYEINEYFKVHGLSYDTINDVIGALECAKMEAYSRIATPYEDKKLQENGDVYDQEILSGGPNARVSEFQLPFIFEGIEVTS